MELTFSFSSNHIDRKTYSMQARSPYSRPNLHVIGHREENIIKNYIPFVNNEVTSRVKPEMLYRKLR